MCDDFWSDFSDKKSDLSFGQFVCDKKSVGLQSDKNQWHNQTMGPRLPLSSTITTIRYRDVCANSHSGKNRKVAPVFLSAIKKTVRVQ